MKRILAVAVICCVASTASFAAKRRALNPVPAQPGVPLRGLPASLLARFEAGRAEFAKRQTLDDGLGPILNGSSCGECHDRGGLGGAGINDVTRIGRMTKDVFDPLIRVGGPTLQVRWLQVRDGSAHEFRGEFLPREATIVAHRRTPSLFGLGLVDATPDATFVALAAEQAVRNDGTAGRVAMVDNLAAGMKTVGKFGWKAQHPTLFQFIAEAFLNELGITNPSFPHENCRNGDCGQMKFNPRPDLNDDGSATQRLVDFVTLLAPPKRGQASGEAVAGEAVFQRIGCESCHVSTLQTGPNDDPALDRVTYHPYSDFLLHDMGTMGDGMHEGSAIGREIRTAPLWGLRFKAPLEMMRAYLHDGLAKSLDAAIERHDGQGRASRDRFRTLNETERAQLLAFLRSL